MSKPPFEDPHAKREAQRYENPVPSREFLADHVKQYGRPVSHITICNDLDLHDDQAEAVRRRLRAMVRDGQLLQVRKGKFLPIGNLDKVKGYVLGHRDGFGFVVPHDGSNDIFLPYRQMRKVFDGDEVIAQITHVDLKGKIEGRIDEVVQHNTQTIVGRLDKRPGHYVLYPDNQRITQEIIIKKKDALSAKKGDFVVAEITQQPKKHLPPEAKVLEVVGKHMAPGMETDVAIRSHSIPHLWPDEVGDETSELSSEPLASDKKTRIDLTQLSLVTIDGEDARDFDDAVFCSKKKSGGWKLYVAIADVSHYVKPNSALDNEAFNRATSVYFPNRVVPMLPEALSNGLCSLKPKVDRLCLVCELSISSEGKVSRFKFYEAVMHSHARLTYTQVSKMLDADNPDTALQQEFSTLLPHLYELQALYKKLAHVRKSRGAINFETNETQIVFGENQKIESIIPRQRNIAHKIIEECMLCANVAAAKFLEKHEIAGLYRVHDGPRSEKLENLREYLSTLGLKLTGGLKPTPSDYQHLLQRIEARPDYFIIQTMLLRSMSQANYQTENRGHFGLAYAAYAHFTSPIRRYPDLMVHRAIRQAIYSGVKSANIQRSEKQHKETINHYPYSLDKLIVIGEHSSLAERRADDASRDVTAWLKCEFLQEHIGETHNGIISAVTSFGFFVELKDIFVEGLVHVRTLNDDYYYYDSITQRFIGERSKRVFQLGDPVSINVLAVNLDERKIDFEINGLQASKKKAKHKKISKKTSSDGDNKSPASKKRRRTKKRK